MLHEIDPNPLWLDTVRLWQQFPIDCLVLNHARICVVGCEGHWLLCRAAVRYVLSLCYFRVVHTRCVVLRHSGEPQVPVDHWALIATSKILDRFAALPDVRAD